MADGTIDNLNIKISADAQKAQKSLNSFANTLEKVNKKFGQMNTRSVGAFAGNVNKLTAALKPLNGLKISVPKLNGLSKELKGISEIDFSKISGVSAPMRELAGALRSLEGLSEISLPKLEAKNINSIVNAVTKLQGVDTSKIQPVSDGITRISHAMSVLNTVDFKDSKITSVANSIRKLMEVDMKGFNGDLFFKAVSSISSLSTLPEISSSVNRFVSSLTTLANAGEKTGQSASGIENLGKGIKKAADELSGIGRISDDTNLFVQSIAKLSNAGGKTGQTAAGLKSLADETFTFFTVMQKAPKVSENTIRMTQALAQLASAGGRVGTATNSVSSAFSKLSSMSSTTGNLVKKAANKITSAIKSIGGSKSYLNKATLGFSSLLKTMIPFLGIQQVFSWTKDAVILGSNIAEVENVVDVSFGSMADKAYEFAATAKEQFGLSELAAKNYAGTLMAMLKSSGVAQDAAADMSIELAGLAGDLASFYNIDTDEAFMKLRSAIAGETEPMRQLGVNMTVKFLLRLYTVMYTESLRERMQKRCAA